MHTSEPVFLLQHQKELELQLIQNLRILFIQDDVVKAHAMALTELDCC